MDEAPAFAAVDPLTPLAEGFAPVAGLQLAALGGCGIVTLMARGGDSAALHARFQAACGFALPDGPGAAFVEGLTAIGTGSGTWLLIRDGASTRFADDIAETLDGVASIVDQSSAYALLTLRGEGARRLLRRGVFLDLDPARFAVGSAAVTMLGHIGLIVWQVDDAPEYRVAVFRSFAPTFRHWIETAALGLTSDR